jgi:uncharacterized membrane protein
MPPWFLLTVLAVLCWGLWAVASKLVGDAVTAAQAQALSAVGLLPVLLVLALRRRPADPGDRRRGLTRAALAGVLTCAGNVAYYHALNLGGKASTVVPLTALYPLVTVVLAVLLLRERLNRVQAAGIVLSLAAIWLFNVGAPGDLANPWIAYALVPVGLWGVSGLLQKLSTADVSGELSALGFLGAFVPVSAALLVYQPAAAPVAARAWPWLVALGLFFGLGNLALLAAFARDGKASVIAPLAGLYPAVSVPLAILCLGEKTNAREAAGIVLSLVAVAALARETPASPSPVPSSSSSSH